MNDEELKLLEAKQKDLAKELREASEKIEKIKAKQEEESLKPLRDIAEKMHDCLCPYNHTDGCSWGYEGDNWNSYAHKEWLDKVKKLVKGDSYTKPVCSVKDMETLVESISSLKKSAPQAMRLIRKAF